MWREIEEDLYIIIDLYISLGFDIFGHGYLSNVFLKIDLDSVSVNEDIESVKWHNRLGNIGKYIWELVYLPSDYKQQVRLEGQM